MFCLDNTCIYVVWYGTCYTFDKITVLIFAGLSEWPDVFYEDRSTDINIHHTCLLDQLVSSNVLDETEGDLIKTSSSNEEKNRKIIRILLCAEKDRYDNFLAVLKTIPDYQALAYRIEDTGITDDDRIKFKTCHPNIAKSI